MAHGGIVDQDVKAAPALRDLIHHACDGGVVGHIGHAQQGLAALRHDLVDHALALGNRAAHIDGDRYPG